MIIYGTPYTDQLSIFYNKVQYIYFEWKHILLLLEFLFKLHLLLKDREYLVFSKP